MACSRAADRGKLRRRRPHVPTLRTCTTQAVQQLGPLIDAWQAEPRPFWAPRAAPPCALLRTLCLCHCRDGSFATRLHPFPLLQHVPASVEHVKMDVVDYSVFEHVVQRERPRRALKLSVLRSPWVSGRVSAPELERMCVEAARREPPLAVEVVREAPPGPKWIRMEWWR